MKKLSILIACALISATSFAQKKVEKQPVVDTVAAAPTSINIKIEDSNIDLFFYLMTKGKIDGVNAEDMLKIAIMLEGIKQQASAQLQARSAPKK